MRRVILAGLVFALLGFAATAAAQNVRNPSVAQWTASLDHQAVTSYVIAFYLPGATDPVQEVDLGKPTPDGTQTCSAAINTMPLTFGVGYIAKMKAVAGGIASEWSLPSNAFDRVPGPPSKAVVK
jgi:hypothetical protein